MCPEKKIDPFEMKRSTLIILTCVVVVCALGLLASSLFNWTVNSDQTSGNVAKSSRFMRKTATEGVTNMEELLRSDESYKDAVVAAYIVMKTRTEHFGTLVDLSNQAAGDIPEFEALLKDMNQAVPLVQNVSEALTKAGRNLNATLEGEDCPEVGQSTANASLAYVMLQKQNSLANRFIKTTDHYLESSEGNDLLKFVRDQWVSYQLTTATLEGDDSGVAKLEKENALLSPEGTLRILKSCDGDQQDILIVNEGLSHLILGNGINQDDVIPTEVLNRALVTGIPAVTDQFENCLNGAYFIPGGPMLMMNELIELAAQGDLGAINIVKLPRY